MVCFGCGKNNIEVVYKETSNFNSWIADNPSYRITDTFRVHGNIFRCLSCGLVFVPRDQALINLLSRFYASQGVDQKYLSEEYGRRRMAQNALDKIAVHATILNSKLIDIGTGPAFFVSEATKKGWQASGLEQGKDWYDFAKKELKMESVELGGLDMLEAKPNNHFGVVAAWDFIEHISDPISFLNLAFSKIEAGGILAISTPRFDSLPSRIFKEKWHAVIPSHITYFTKPVLVTYLKKVGFEVLEVSSYKRYFSIQYLFNRLFHKKHKSFLGNVVIPVNLFDEVEIYCRKPLNKK